MKGGLSQIDADRRDMHETILQCMLPLRSSHCGLIEAADHLINRLFTSYRF
jgi:hypothetical protein